MTLRQLLSKCSYKSVFNALYRDHYKDKEDDEVEWYDIAYLGAWNQLINKDIIPNNKHKIYIREIVDDYTDPPEEYINVCLLDNKDNKTYAIDLTLWDDLIDMEIKNETSINDTNTLANILWEITFYGFTDDHVKTQREELTALAKRIDSGDEELIPFDITDLDEDCSTDK